MPETRVAIGGALEYEIPAKSAIIILRLRLVQRLGPRPWFDQDWHLSPAQQPPWRRARDMTDSCRREDSTSSQVEDEDEAEAGLSPVVLRVFEIVRF